MKKERTSKRLKKQEPDDIDASEAGALDMSKGDADGGAARSCQTIVAFNASPQKRLHRKGVSALAGFTFLERLRMLMGAEYMPRLCALCHACLGTWPCRCCACCSSNQRCYLWNMPEEGGID